MIFYYRCPFCCKPYHEDARGPRHREVLCKFHQLGIVKMTPDGITYDEVVKGCTGPKASGESEPSSSGNTGQ